MTNVSARARMSKKRARRSVLTSVLMAFACAAGLLVGCARDEKQPVEAGDEITVAAASSLTGAFEELARDFTAKTGIKVTCSFGATADLARQIEQGAPFDAFAAADVAHVKQLAQKNLVVTDSQRVFARGRLVVWTPPGGAVSVARVEDLTKDEVRHVAVAKPELAPYGRAGVEALRALNLWAQIGPKVVYAQNVWQARQFAASGNADAALLPLALVKPGEGAYVEVDEALYQPIDHSAGVVRASGKQAAARAFVEYLTSAKGQALLERYGYRRPPAAR